jgi:hypothetical protein
MAVNQTIVQFCQDSVLNTGLSKNEVTWEFLQYAFKPILGFLIGFMAGFLVVTLIGMMIGSKGMKRFIVFVLAPIVATLCGLGGLWIATYMMMNGG